MNKTLECGMCSEAQGFITGEMPTVSVVIAKPWATLPLKRDTLCTVHTKIISGEVADAIARGAELILTLSPIGE